MTAPHDRADIAAGLLDGAEHDAGSLGPRARHAALVDPARLAAVAATGLAHGSIPGLDAMARLAARALRTPVAQVNIVTADAQVPLASAAHAEALPDGNPARWSMSVDLDASFCQHVVERAQAGNLAPLLVEDARAHPLVRDSRATTEGGIVAYAAVPLRTPDGHVLGSVCAVDFAPRSWTAHDASVLEEVAAFAADELTRRAVAVATVERQAALTRLVADNATSALFLMDRHGHPTYMNPAAVAMTGFTLDEIRHSPLHDAIHHHRPDGSPYPKAECPIDRALPENSGVRAHADVFIRKDGAYFPVLCTASPILEDGVPVGTVVEIRDVTAEREAEAALHTMNALLAERTAAAEAANAAKSQFLATMSHELRTPLNAIGGYTELLELGLRGPVTEAQQADLVRIRRSQQHLLGLINDVLNFARLEAGRVHYAVADVPLGPALDDVAVLVEPQARARGIAYEATADCSDLVARADREKLQQILVNLLTNAVKFTDPPGTITLSCDAASGPDGGAVVLVRVRDTGIGIPPERLEHIFEPFVQVTPSLNRTRDGVGLGLAICRELACGMGGDLTVESRVGEGSTFTLTLPRAVSTGHAPPAAPNGSVPGGSGANDPASEVEACRRLLADHPGAADGVRAVLAYLNGRVAYRYTGLYRFDGEILRSVALHDREDPTLRVGAAAPMRETYCAVVGATARPFAVEDARTELRGAGHPAADAVVSYCGALVRAADGRAVGTLCHFDLRPQPVPAGEIPVLEQVALLLGRAAHW